MVFWGKLARWFEVLMARVISVSPWAQRWAQPTCGSSDVPSWIILFQWSFERGYLKIAFRKVWNLVRLSLVILRLEEIIQKRQVIFQSTEVFFCCLWRLLSVCVISPDDSVLVSRAAWVRSSLHGCPCFPVYSISALHKEVQVPWGYPKWLFVLSNHISRLLCWLELV